MFLGRPVPNKYFFSIISGLFFTGHFLSFDFSFTFHVILAKPKAFKGKYINIETSRETREGLPLLTVKTEVNGVSKSTNENSPSLVGFWACHAGSQDFCSALDSFRPNTKYFFPQRTLF
jgi:hypothetical protein